MAQPSLTPGAAVLAIALSRIQEEGVLEIHDLGVISVEALEELSSSRSPRDTEAFMRRIGATLEGHGGTRMLHETTASLETPDHLVDAFEAVSECIEPDDDTFASEDETEFGRYKPMSTAGWFLRRSVAEFRLMSFDQVCALHRCILDMTQHKEDTLVVTESNLRILQSAESVVSIVSRGEEPSPELLSVRYEIPQVSPIDLMHHFGAIRRKEYSTALHALHRYYDRTLSEQHGHSPQDAVLSLAAMNFSFGYAEGPVALSESNRIAQKAGDQICQNRVTEWMSRTGQSRKRLELLRVLAESGSETTSDAEHIAAAHQRRANALIALAKAENEELIVIPPGTRKVDLIVEKTVEAAGVCPSLAADALLVEAAAWESHGCLVLAQIRTKVALMRAQPKSDQWSRAVAAQSTLEYSQGSAAKAFERLKSALAEISNASSAGAEFHRPQKELLTQCLTKLEFDKALKQGKLQIAGELCTVLAEAADAGREGTMFFDSSELKCDALETQSRLLMAKENFSEAIQVVFVLIENAMALNKPVRALHGLLLGAEAYLAVHDGASSMKWALAVLSIAESLDLHSWRCRATIRLSMALEILGEGVFAIRSMRLVLPSVVEGLPLHDTGLAHLAIGRSLLSFGREKEGFEEIRLADAIFLMTENWVDRQVALTELINALNSCETTRDQTAKQLLLNTQLLHRAKSSTLS